MTSHESLSFVTIRRFPEIVVCSLDLIEDFRLALGLGWIGELRCQEQFRSVLRASIPLVEPSLHPHFVHISAALAVSAEFVRIINKMISSEVMKAFAAWANHLFTLSDGAHNPSFAAYVYMLQQFITEPRFTSSPKLRSLGDRYMEVIHNCTHWDSALNISRAGLSAWDGEACRIFDVSLDPAEPDVERLNLCSSLSVCEEQFQTFLFLERLGAQLPENDLEELHGIADTLFNTLLADYVETEGRIQIHRISTMVADWRLEGVSR